ncbi:MAG: HypC/HybG/HupF family hydrogenase formation chaperone [Candidatus Omnitrophota bacterium]
MCLAVPAKVEKVEKQSAVVDFGGVRKRISLGIQTGVSKGDYVLVHAGFAIGKVKEKEAEDTRLALEELKNAVNAIKT